MNHVVASKESYQQNVSQYQMQGEQLLQRMNQYLGTQTAQSLADFTEAFTTKRIPECVILNSIELSWAQIIADITVEELSNDVDGLFVHNGQSIDQLMAVIKQVQFALWRVEFDEDTEAEQYLYEKMKQYHLSEEALGKLIEITSVDAKRIYAIVACVELDQHRVREAIRIFEEALRRYPEDPELMQPLAGLYASIGRTGFTDRGEEQKI